MDISCFRGVAGDQGGAKLNNKGCPVKRDIFSLSLDLGHELSIDNFAGGGGASTGIAMGLGREVDIAINHDGEALAMHAANHPTSAHYREDVFSIHPGFVTKQLPIGLAWFSPDCKHFSKAKGAKPVEKEIRGLAWVTLKWATFQMPRVIALENVEEFQDWGPLGPDNKPIKAEKGRTFKAFVLALSIGIPKDHPDLEEIYDVLGHDFPIERLCAGLGYKVEWRVMRACDYGAPTIRKRLFLLARRDGLPIVWPAPTHGDPKTDAVKSGKLLPWRTAAECIDWSIPCPSIFERKKPLAEATQRRIAKGIMRYVVNAANPFIVGQGGPIYSGKPVSANQPIGTLTTENHRSVVVPVLAGVGGRAGQSRPRGVDEPFATITSKADGAVVSAFLAKHYTGVVGSDLEDPIGTVTGVDHHSLVTTFLTEHANASNQRNMPTNEPLRTICAQVKGGHFGLVTAHIQRDMGQSVGHAVDAPLGTVTAGGGGKSAMVASHLVKLRGTSSTASMEEPLHTVSAGGQHHGEVRAFLIKYYSEGGQDQSLADPMHTVPTKDRLGLVTIKGVDYAIVDIGLRMLSPRELARAQGFPDSYILNPIVNGKPLTNAAQVRMIGNSVCPPMAAALVKANFSHERQIVRVA